MRYVLCALDATVWPKNELVNEALQVLHTVCSMGSANMGYIQYPLLHSQTSLTAQCKHRRYMEDKLLNTESDFSTSFTLLFNKQGMRADSSQPSSQQCVLITVGNNNKWSQSAAYQNGFLGPLALTPMRDLIGYDPDNRPGASSRVEQRLGYVWLLFSLPLPCNQCAVIGHDLVFVTASLK